MIAILNRTTGRYSAGRHSCARLVDLMALLREDGHPGPIVVLDARTMRHVLTGSWRYDEARDRSWTKSRTAARLCAQSRTKDAA